jgi:cyanophycin synthetase
VPTLLRDTLISEGVPPDQIELIPDEVEATEAGLRAAHAGDLLLIFGDNVARSWEQIVTFRPLQAERRAARRPRTRPAPGPMPPAERPASYVRDVRGVRFARETVEVEEEAD